MADILVCIKRVPDVSGEVLLTDDGQHVDARHVGYTVSPHELCAVELAVQVAGDTGGSVTVMTLGTDESVDKLRDAVAVGATGAILVEVDDPDAFGPRDVAAALAEVVQSGLLRPGAARQRRRRHRRLPGRRPAGLPARPPGRRRCLRAVRRGRQGGRDGRRPRRHRRLRGAACPPSSRCSRAASSRATRPSSAA